MTLDALLEQLAELVADRVATRLNGKAAPQGDAADRLLDVDEVAAVLGVTRRWVYRRAKSLSFTRRQSRGVLRFSQAGLRAYMATGRRGA